MTTHIVCVTIMLLMIVAGGIGAAIEKWWMWTTSVCLMFAWFTFGADQHIEAVLEWMLGREVGSWEFLGAISGSLLIFAGLGRLLVWVGRRLFATRQQDLIGAQQ